MSKKKMYEVIATNLKTGNIRVIAEGTKQNADAALLMAVIRRGVTEEFFTTRCKED